jgi:RimJ/RimL family protein N-acetyltransferase
MNLTIDLAPIGRADLPQLLAWRNDWRIIQWSRQSDLLNEVTHAEWFERQAKDPTTRMYKMVLRTPGTTSDVGVCGLTSVDHFNRRAEFSLYVAPVFQRRGIGRAALRVLLSHAFDNLGLNVVFGETFDGNPAAKMFEALGMVKEGTRRQFYWRDGRLIDAHIYSITSEEWSHGRNADTADSRDVGGGERDPSAALPTPISRGRGRPRKPRGPAEVTAAAARAPDPPPSPGPGGAA